MPERLLSTVEAAAYLGLHPQTLKKWRTAGGGSPPYIKVSANRCRYAPDALRKWEAERTHRHTADGPGRAA